MHSINGSSWHVFPLHNKDHDFPTRSMGQMNSFHHVESQSGVLCVQWAEFIPQELLTRGEIDMIHQVVLEEADVQVIHRPRE